MDFLLQELFKTGSKTRMGFLKVPTEDIESRVSATLENEVIDPILRVHRAFEFAQNRRECAKYVICFVNRSKDSARTGLKPGITKLLR